MTDAEICKAVAELAGWKAIDPCVDSVGDPAGWWGTLDGNRREVPDYANSLDAIVPVVREWCDKHDGDFDIQWYGGDRRSYSAIVWGDKEPPHQQAGDDPNPARALCLALIEAHAAMSKKGYDHFPATRDTETP